MSRIFSRATQLYDDVETLKSSLTKVKFPYLPRRRESKNRLTREIDDILLLFTFLGEQKLLDMLPRYIADSPDTMPPIRLYESELNGIVLMIKRLADKVDEYSAVLSAVTRHLQSSRRHLLFTLIDSTHNDDGEHLVKLILIQLCRLVVAGVVPVNSRRQTKRLNSSSSSISSSPYNQLVLVLPSCLESPVALV